MFGSNSSLSFHCSTPLVRELCLFVHDQRDCFTKLHVVGFVLSISQSIVSCGYTWEIIWSQVIVYYVFSTFGSSQLADHCTQSTFVPIIPSTIIVSIDAFSHATICYAAQCISLFTRFAQIQFVWSSFDIIRPIAPSKQHSEIAYFGWVNSISW